MAVYDNSIDITANKERLDGEQLKCILLLLIHPKIFVMNLVHGAMNILRGNHFW